MYRGVNEPVRPLKDLPRRHREFIKLYIRSGDPEASYRKVGYTGKKSAASRLHRELAPYYPAAMTEYLKGVEMGILGAKVVRELALGAKTETVRLNAAKELLERAAPEDPKESVVTHVHKTLSNEDIDKRLKELQDELFIDAPVLKVV